MIVYTSSSTGQSRTLAGGPFSRVSVEAVGGPGTLAVEGRVGGSWREIIASSTFTSTGYSVTASTGFLVSTIRANVSAVGSTDGISVHLLGA